MLPAGHSSSRIIRFPTTSGPETAEVFGTLLVFSGLSTVKVGRHGACSIMRYYAHILETLSRRPRLDAIQNGCSWSGRLTENVFGSEHTLKL